VVVVRGGWVVVVVVLVVVAGPTDVAEPVAVGRTSTGAL
jgi:hypothetical protein